MSTKYIYVFTSASLRALAQKPKQVLKRDAKGRFISPKSPAAIEKNPMAYFEYPDSKTGWTRSRIVRVIASNLNDLIGLEKNPNTEKWQYKHFKMRKVRGLSMEYAPQSMPVFNR